MQRFVPRPFGIGITRLAVGPLPWSSLGPRPPRTLAGNLSIGIREEPNRVTGIVGTQIAAMQDAELARIKAPRFRTAIEHGFFGPAFPASYFGEQFPITQPITV